MKLSIVIPVFNNWNFTRSCLSDLIELPCDTHEIIVVDNGSTDNTREGLSTVFEKGRITYLDLGTNTGFAHACNHGFSQSSGDYVMFLNNDIRVKSDKKNWTSRVLEKADEALVGPTGGLLDSSFNFIKETNRFIDSPYFYMSGWNLTSSREIWNKLIISEYAGPFSEEFGIAYFEDTDLGFRAHEQGIPLEIVDVPVVHFGKVTSKKLNTLSLYLPAKEKFIAKWKARQNKS